MNAMFTSITFLWGRWGISNLCLHWWLDSQYLSIPCRFYMIIYKYTKLSHSHLQLQLGCAPWSPTPRVPVRTRTFPCSLSSPCLHIWTNARSQRICPCVLGLSLTIQVMGIFSGQSIEGMHVAIVHVFFCMHVALVHVFSETFLHSLPSLSCGTGGA